MAQITEYSLVVLVSTLFAGASVATYGGYIKFESAAEAKASFIALTSLANDALEDGSAESTMFLPSSTVSCSGGSLGLDAGGFLQIQAVAADCNFNIAVSRGLHRVAFTDRFMLSLKVS